MDIEPAPTSIREELLARPDIHEVLTPTPHLSIREELLARPDIDEILGRKLQDLSEVQRPRGLTRRRLLQGAAAAAAVALGGGTISQIERITGSPNTPPTLLPEAENEQINSFNELIKPLIDEARRRRKLHPEGIDWELNQNRVNIGLSTWADGQGESLTVLSYDLISGTITSVITTRETLSPEVMRFSKKKYPDMKFVYQMDASTAMFIHQTGGFELMRRVIQNQTGLAADFQFYMKDIALHDFIKNVLGDKVTIDVEKRLNLVDFAFDRRWKDNPGDPDEFVLEAGKHTMTAKQAMRYVLSDSNQEWVTGVNHQLPERKNHVIKAAFHRLAELLSSNLVEAGKTGASLTRFLQENLFNGQLASDYDFLGGSGVLVALLGQLGKAKLSGVKITFPEVGGGGGLQINDELFGDSHGDTGIIRVNRLISPDNTPSENYFKYAHPSIQRLVDETIKVLSGLQAEGIHIADPKKGLATRLATKEVLPPWLQIPILGDIEVPESELPDKYWGASRRLVKEKLAI